MWKFSDSLPTRQKKRLGVPTGTASQRSLSEGSTLGSTLESGAGTGAHDGVSSEDYHALQDELQNERRLRIEAERRLSNHPTAANVLPTSDPFAVTDETIVTLVRELRQDIRTWSTNFSYNPRKYNKRKDAKATQAMTKWQRRVIYPETDRERRLADLNEDSMRIMYQANLWDQLLIKVFGRHLWAGGHCQKADAEAKTSCKTYDFLRTYEPHFKKAYRSRYRAGAGHELSEIFFKWRSQSSRMVIPTIHEECAQVNVKHRISEIREIFEKSGMHTSVKSGTWREAEVGSDRSNEVVITLQKIVEDATKLDRILCVQVDYYSFTGMFKDKAIALNPGWMDIHDGSRSRMECQPWEVQCIMLTRAPALFKGFTRKYPLVTAIVELGTTTAPRQPGGGAGGDFDDD